ncbi:hypothetical protein O3M35_003503 [Rhynocoris fuscipes]|uniref:Uncharacterized protein n=1 Tax=Rhynocoris fuscipes TaxID=488301 RepID=A0AAW1CKD9_9HEMI
MNGSSWQLVLMLNSLWFKSGLAGNLTARQDQDSIFRFPAKPDKDKSSKITNVPSHPGPVHILESSSHPGIKTTIQLDNI